MNKNTLISQVDTCDYTDVSEHKEMKLTEENKKEIIGFTRKWYGKIDDKLHAIKLKNTEEYTGQATIIGSESGLLHLACLILDLISTKDENDKIRGLLSSGLVDPNSDFQLDVIEKKKADGKEYIEKKKSIKEKLIITMIAISFIGLLGFVIYLFIFWINHL